MSSQEAENRRNQIDRYVNGEMDTEEITVFELRMRENGALAEEVHLHRDVLVGMNQYFNLDLKRILQEEEAKLKKKPVNFYKWAGIAASIVLVIAISYLVFFTGQTDSKQLYAQYYKPYPNIVTPAQRSESSTTDPGLSLYEAGNYTEALKHLEQQISQGSQAPYLAFYAGIAALNTDEETKAKNYFEKVINRQDETFANPAQWYLGLTYLKSGEKKEAALLFEEIKTSGNDYSQRAAEILEDL
jgi:tetratricopeptide (TPR) repeat protein